MQTIRPPQGINFRKPVGSDEVVSPPTPPPLPEVAPSSESQSSIRVGPKVMPQVTETAVTDAETALALVSYAGEAIRQLETQSREAVTRALDAAEAVKRRLDNEEIRAERAEFALQEAETEIERLATSLSQAHDDIRALNSLINQKSEELSGLERRADLAERQVSEGNASIQKILTALRTEFKIASLITDIPE